MVQNDILKPSLQLEGYSIFTELNQQVYDELRNSSSKYLLLDEQLKKIILKKSFFKKNKQVPNVVRYFAKVNGNDLFLETVKAHHLLKNSQFEDELITSSNKLKTIAIIIESPHVEEYTISDGKLIPIATAQGIIGRKIDANIEKLLWSLMRKSVLNENEMYRIVIMNAVPYQSSLYHIHQKNMDNRYRELRDKVWTKMWSEIPSIRNEFNKLINSLRKDSVLINTCTKSIKPFINQELVGLHHKFFLFESNHPSSTEPWAESLFLLNEWQVEAALD